MTNIDVMFRVFQGDVIALFPHEVHNNHGDVVSYMHVGQHGSADYKDIVRNARLATPTEYLPLMRELESIGYHVSIVRRQDSRIYSKAWYNVRNPKPKATK